MLTHSVLTIKGSNDRLNDFKEEAEIADLPVYFYNSETVMNLKKVRTWIEIVHAGGYTIEELASRSVVGNPNNPVMVGLIAKIAGIPFAVEASIQGISISLAIRLISATTGKPYLAFVEQDRPVVGMRGCEFVAGRQDGTSIQSQAVNELITEAHLDRVVNLTAEEKEKYKTKDGGIDYAAYLSDKISWYGGIHSSMGGVFEFVRVGEITLVVPDETIKEMHGKLTGDKHEKGMVLKIAPEEDILKYITGDPRVYYWLMVRKHGAPEYHPAFEAAMT